MKILPEPVEFEWNKGNVEKNLIKHRVTNKETEEIFKNKDIFIFKDEKHSQKEERYGLFGKIDSGRLLSVVFTLRNNKVRIITVRDMSRKERKAYEKIKRAETNSKV